MKYLSISMMPVAALGMALMSGCEVEPARVVFRPPVIVAPPPPPPVVVEPAPVVVVDVPDYYVWDGVEYVGYVGDSCFYLGPGNVWLVCDPIRLGRFHDWERYHPEWRTRLAIRNDRFRNDRNGHYVPRRDEHGPARREDRREDHRDDHREDHRDDRR